MKKNNRATKSNPKGAGRKPGWGVNYVGQKFAGWTVIENMGYIGKSKKNYYWKLQSPENKNNIIILRTDTMKKFTGHKLWTIAKKQNLN